MTNKRYFLLAGILAFIGLAGVSCSIYSENHPIVTLTPAPVTQTPVTTQPPTDIPTQTATPYFIPLGPTSLPSPTAMPPYPTASVVKANAVAFIAENALWVANVDGSGERKLADIEPNSESTLSSYLFQWSWSPDGKWIAYISADELWIVSPDGFTKRKALSTQDTTNKLIRLYKWSPDSSKIAFIQGGWLIRLLDLSTGKISELPSYFSGATITLFWSPDGRYLLFSKDFSFFVYEISTHKFVKEIKTRDFCWTSEHDELAWSPNDEWFYHVHHGNGRYASDWICVSGLDGSNRQINIDGSSSIPVWDKTGNSLYFVARKTNPDNIPNLDIDLRLMRYYAQTQKLERILSLGGDSQQSSWSAFMSPDQDTLALLTCTSDDSPKCSFIIIDAQSQSIINKFIVNINFSLIRMYEYPNPWAPDNRNIILFARELDAPNKWLSGYTSFYAVDVKTGKALHFSGSHHTEYWAVSPIATTP